MDRATILCFENHQSAFAASQEVSGSGRYHVVAATSTAAGVTAAKVISGIAAAVLPASVPSPDRQLEIANQIDHVRPGLPKLVIGDSAASAVPQELRRKLALHYVAAIQELVRELRLILVVQRAECR